LSSQRPVWYSDFKEFMPKTGAWKDEQFLSSDEVVELLLADPVLRSKSATCVLPAIRLGDGWAFRRSDLDAWIAQHLNDPGLDDRSVD
jgi:hypothetical protein